MPHEETINELVNGALPTRSTKLTRLRPDPDAPRADQPGSVDFWVTQVFGSRDNAFQWIDALVRCQGEHADDKWRSFAALYQKWLWDYKRGDILEPPTFNQVCLALEIDTIVFQKELQGGMKQYMNSMAKSQAIIASPMVIKNLMLKATSDEADVKDIELALKIGGIIEEQGAMSINISQQQGILLKTEKEKLKSPLLQFNDTVVEIDNAVRKDYEAE